MSLRVTAVTLIGYDHDYLDRILYQWIAEGFQVEGPVVDFAYDLREKIAASNGDAVSPAREREGC